jgi:hypothetical protein
LRATLSGKDCRLAYTRMAWELCAPLCACKWMTHVCVYVPLRAASTRVTCQVEDGLAGFDLGQHEADNYFKQVRV